MVRIYLRTYPLSLFGVFNCKDTAEDLGGTFGGGFDVFEGRTEGALEDAEGLESEFESESESEVDDEAEELSSEEDSSDDDDDADEEDEEGDIARAGAALVSAGLEAPVEAESFAFFRGGGPGDRDRRVCSGDVPASITCCILRRRSHLSVHKVLESKALGHTRSSLHP